MKIFVTGTRGIPDIPGGVEKHCQELYPLIADMGHDIIVATRTPYVTNKNNLWNNIRLKHLFAPRKKSLEAIIHTFLAIIYAKIEKPDIIHIHAVGPGLMVPLAKFLGLNVVLTNHGPDYDREKWGKAAKVVLKIGEYMGGRYANEVIVISKVIENIITKRCKRISNIIYNGVPLPEKSLNSEFLNQMGVYPGKFVLAVSRFVPEKGLHDLIDAFLKLDTDMKLVIAGDADHETEYSRQIKNISNQNRNILLTGYVTGEPLNQLFSHAALFVLPSYHEGLPIALLEAISYGIPVLVSDIPANLEVGLNGERYFKCGDVRNLTEKLKILLSQGISEKEKDALQEKILTDYNWQKIAVQTVKVYEKTLSKYRHIDKKNYKNY